MAGNLELAVKITTDGKAAVIDLELVRKAILGNYAAAKDGVAAANAKLAEAQQHAQSLATALKADGVAGEAFSGWMAKARDAVRAAKDDVIAKTSAMQALRASAQENAASVDALRAAQASQAGAQEKANSALVAGAAARARDTAAAIAAKDAKRDLAVYDERDRVSALKAADAAALATAARGRETEAIHAQVAAMQALQARGSNALAERGINAATQALARSSTETARAAGSALLLERAHAALNAQLARGQISQTQHAAALQNLNAQYGKAAEGTDRLGGSIGRVAHYAAGLVVLSQVVGYAKQALDLAEGYKQIEARLKLATTTSAEFAAAQASVARIASTTGAPLAEVAALYTRMGPVLKEVGYEQRQVSDLGEIVAKSLRLSGTGAAEATSTMRQFVQAMGSGVLRGDEFNSLMENAPVLMHNLAKGMDVPIGQLRKMAEEGELSSKKVAEALLKMKDRIDKDFSQLPVSVSQAWQRLINDVQTGIGEMDKANGATATLAAGLEFVRKNLDAIATSGAMIGGVLAVMGTVAAIATPAGAAIAVVTVTVAALAAGIKRLTGEQKKLAADTTKADETMGELNKAIVKLSAEKADPGIIEGIKRVREAAASGAISIDQAAFALAKFIALRESVQGKGTAADTYFKEFLPDAKKFQEALDELKAHADAARAKGTFSEAAYQRALNKIIDESNTKKQALYNADAQARLKAMIPPTEAVREALQKLEDEYRIAQKNGVADEVKYQQDRVKIIAEALADGAGKVAETRQRISQETRQRAIGDLAFQEEQIRKGYAAEVAAARGQADETALLGDVEKRIETEVAALRKKLAGEFIAGNDAATKAALKNAQTLATGEVAAATQVAAVWSQANAAKAQKTGGAIMNQGTPGEFVSSWDAAGNYVGDLGSTISRAAGGPIAGPGSGTSDSILARVSNGEYVVRAAAVARYGSGFMEAINRMALPTFAAGGKVGAGGTPATGGIVIQNLNLPGVSNARAFVAELKQMLRTDPGLLSAGTARVG